MASISPWIQAARPLAQVNLAVPLIYGQALAFARYGDFDLRIAGVLAVYGVALHLVIVFANDLADEAADRQSPQGAKTPFSGGSRVLVDGLLGRAELTKAALIAGAGALSAALFLTVFFGRLAMVVAPLAAGALLWLYSFAPFRLSYRGRGELLEGLGCGVVLPLTAFYAQTGDLGLTALPPLVPAFLLGVASNILTSLPDEPADRATGKQSYSVRFGGWQARRHAIELTLLAGVLGHLVIPDFSRIVDLLFAAPALVLTFLGARLLGSADPQNPGECARFVLLVGGAGHLLLVLWSVALVWLGLAL